MTGGPPKSKGLCISRYIKSTPDIVEHELGPRPLEAALEARKRNGSAEFQQFTRKKMGV